MILTGKPIFTEFYVMTVTPGQMHHFPYIEGFAEFFIKEVHKYFAKIGTTYWLVYGTLKMLYIFFDYDISENYQKLSQPCDLTI